LASYCLPTLLFKPQQLSEASMVLESRL